MTSTHTLAKPETLNLNLVLDPGHEVRAAADLRSRLPRGQWTTLLGLAAEIVALNERETGSLVLVISADQATREVAKHLRAPGLEKLPGQLVRP